jgi:hypothetical protein
MTEFSTLGELFRIPIELSKKGNKRVNLNKDVIVPICQHNIYKLSPYHVHQLQTHKYEIWLPQERKSFFDDLDFPVGTFEMDDSGAIVYNTVETEVRQQCGWKTPEDRDSKMLLSCVFSEIESFSLEELGVQLYLSYANSFNYEMWYSIVQNVKFVNPFSGKEDKLVSDSYLFDLTDAEVQLIYDLHLKADRGKYLGNAYSELLAMKREIQPRLDPFLPLVSKEELVPSEEKDEPPTKVIEPFYFKLNTRSAKDSTFYKESGVLAAIKKDSSSLKKCQARTAFDILSAMVASKRAAEDCRSYIHWKIKSGRKPSLKVVVQRYVRKVEVLLRNLHFW